MHSERRRLKIRPNHQGGQAHETTQQQVSDVPVEEVPPVREASPPPVRRRPARQAWGIEAVEEPKKKRVNKANMPKPSPFGMFGGKRKKDKSPKTCEVDAAPPDHVPAGEKRKFPWQREKQPEVSHSESGAVTVPDLLAPASADFTSRDYVIVDGFYHAYLYITGYGYTTIVGNGWLNPIIEAGEDINVSFFISKQPKDKILNSIAKTTMINRSRMRDVGDTRQDYEELDSAISSGLYLKDSINRNGEDFYYMHTLIEVVAPNPDVLEQRVSAMETLCTSLDVICRRCDYRQEQAFLSSLPLAQLDADIERKSRRNALTSGVAAAFPFSSFEICDQSGIMLGINLHNRSVCMLDVFDATKYANANMSLLAHSLSATLGLASRTTTLRCTERAAALRPCQSSKICTNTSKRTPTPRALRWCSAVLSPARPRGSGSTRMLTWTTSTSSWISPRWEKTCCRWGCF